MGHGCNLCCFVLLIIFAVLRCFASNAVSSTTFVRLETKKDGPQQGTLTEGFPIKAACFVKNVSNITSR
jgi:hypothetical protein